jgi:hypothetical protein
LILQDGSQAEKEIATMSPKDAITLLHTLVAAEIEVVKAASTGRGITKKLEKQERRAVREAFLALTGIEPTPEQITEVCSY